MIIIKMQGSVGLRTLTCLPQTDFTASARLAMLTKFLFAVLSRSKFPCVSRGSRVSQTNVEENSPSLAKEETVLLIFSIFVSVVIRFWNKVSMVFSSRLRNLLSCSRPKETFSKLLPRGARCPVTTNLSWSTCFWSRACFCSVLVSTSSSGKRVAFVVTALYTQQLYLVEVFYYNDDDMVLLSVMIWIVSLEITSRHLLARGAFICC